MPNLRSSRITPIGLLIGIGFAIILYLTQPTILQTIVYTTYLSLIDPLQLYELAWIMATIDLLLNFSFQLSLYFWVAIAILVAILIRNLHVSLTTLGAAILLPSGTWLLFTIKYLNLPGLSIPFLLNFLIWQTLVPLGIVLGLATIISLPFMAYQRQKPSTTTAPTSIQSTCSNCGSNYQSLPLICVQCGQENTIIEKRNSHS